MRIKIDEKHWLYSDSRNWWITVEYTNKNGTVAEREVSGYWDHLDDLLSNYVEQRISSSDCETLKELAKELRALKRAVKGWKVNVEAER